MKNIANRRFFVCVELSAQAQRIDFDNAPLNPGRDTEDKYIGWTVDKAVADTLTDIEVPGDETRKLTLVVNCGDQSVTNRTLKSNWWKDGVNKHSKLVGDCVAVYGLILTATLLSLQRRVLL